MVKTPSSCVDSFLICTAKTWASSMIEKSVSAPQIPQQKRLRTIIKLHVTTCELFQCSKDHLFHSDGAFPVKIADPFRGRLAMMAGSLNSKLGIRVAGLGKTSEESALLLNFADRFGVFVETDPDEKS